MHTQWEGFHQTHHCIYRVSGSHNSDSCRTWNGQCFISIKNKLNLIRWWCPLCTIPTSSVGFISVTQQSVSLKHIIQIQRQAISHSLMPIIICSYWRSMTYQFYSLWFDPTWSRIHYIRGEHASHYTTDAQCHPNTWARWAVAQRSHEQRGPC
jgi:hypothetical protein